MDLVTPTLLVTEQFEKERNDLLLEMTPPSDRTICESHPGAVHGGSVDDGSIDHTNQIATIDDVRRFLPILPPGAIVAEDQSRKHYVQVYWDQRRFPHEIQGLKKLRLDFEERLVALRTELERLGESRYSNELKQVKYLLSFKGRALDAFIESFVQDWLNLKNSEGMRLPKSVKFGGTVSSKSVVKTTEEGIKFFAPEIDTALADTPHARGFLSKIWVNTTQVVDRRQHLLQSNGEPGCQWIPRSSGDMLGPQTDGSNRNEQLGILKTHWVELHPDKDTKDLIYDLLKTCDVEHPSKSDSFTYKFYYADGVGNAMDSSCYLAVTFDEDGGISNVMISYHLNYSTFNEVYFGEDCHQYLEPVGMANREILSLLFFTTFGKRHEFPPLVLSIAGLATSVTASLSCIDPSVMDEHDLSAHIAQCIDSSPIAIDPFQDQPTPISLVVKKPGSTVPPVHRQSAIKKNMRPLYPDPDADKKPYTSNKASGKQLVAGSRQSAGSKQSAGSRLTGSRQSTSNDDYSRRRRDLRKQVDEGHSRMPQGDEEASTETQDKKRIRELEEQLMKIVAVMNSTQG